MTIKQVVGKQIMANHASGLAYAPGRDAETINLKCAEYRDAFFRAGIKDKDSVALEMAWQMWRDGSKNWSTPSEIINTSRYMSKYKPQETRKLPDISDQQRQQGLQHIREITKKLGIVSNRLN